MMELLAAFTTTFYLQKTGAELAEVGKRGGETETVTGVEGTGGGVEGTGGGVVE